MQRHDTRGGNAPSRNAQDRNREPDDLRPVQRAWDNAGLRHRVEGREIDGVDVIALQTAVLAKEERSQRRRPRSS